MRKILFLGGIIVLITSFIPVSFSLALVSGTHSVNDIIDPDCSFYGNFPGDSTQNFVAFFFTNGSNDFIFGCQELQEGTTWQDHSPGLDFSGLWNVKNLIEVSGANVHFCVNNDYDTCLPYALATSTVTITTPLRIDIKPQGVTNDINIKSHGRIVVAILSAKDFDAFVDVDVNLLTFGKTGDETSLAFCNKSRRDVNNDGLPDLICFFETPKTGFQVGDSVGILKGKTNSGQLIEGKDSVNIR